MQLARRLVRHIGNALRDPLPPPVDSKVRRHIADTLGISLAAMRVSAEVAAALGAAMAGGAAGRCRVVGSAIFLPPVQAAFVNSAAAHALDFDDVHDQARLHVTAVTLPAALAAADVVSAFASDLASDLASDIASNVALGGAGRLLHAVALGNDTMCRLGLSLQADASGAAGNWLLTQLMGYTGAAVAAGIVLGLDEDQLVSALGLAYMQAAGGKETAMGTGSNARSIYTGFSAAGGVQAALLARAGMTAPGSSLDGRASLYRIYLDRQLSEDAMAKMLGQPGQDWPWLGTDLKPWPCCRLSHPFVGAALELVSGTDHVEVADIEEVAIHVNASAATLCRPLDARIKPQTLADAKYSVPFVTAFALVHQRVDLSILNEGALQDRRVLDLAAKVRIVEDRPDRPGLPVGAIVVRGRDGRRWQSEHELGVAWDDAAVKRKFDGCLAFAGLAAAADSAWESLRAGPVADLASQIFFKALQVQNAKP